MNALGKTRPKGVLVPTHTSLPEVSSKQEEAIIQQTTSTHTQQTEFSFEKNSVLGVELSLEQSRSQVATNTSNADSRRMLQEALLGVQFQRVQTENKSEIEHHPKIKFPNQEALLSSLKRCEHKDAVTTLLQHSKMLDAKLYACLPWKMQKEPAVFQAYINKSRDRLSSDISCFKEANQSESERSELGLSSQSHNFGDVYGSLLERKIDGSRYQELASGRKDGLITESEILANIGEVLSSDSLSFTQAQELAELESCLHILRSKGAKFRITRTGKSTVEVTPKRNFDSEKIERLDKMVSHSIGNRLKSAEMTIEKANLTDIHKQIPDAFEKAIYGYTTDDYKKINSSLRSENVGEELQVYIDGACEGLRQMPSHSGIVWRGADLSPDILAKYVPGEDVVEKGFTSTSFGTMAEFPGRKTYFCIQLKDEGSAGKRVDHLSAYQCEKEVLFPPDTRFRTLAVENAGESHKGRVIVYLQEK